MDFNTLKDSVSNLTLYDIKAGVRKVQNAVMNYTEIEAKVREATNNEPWGASSSLMQEIANATFNYQTLNEIMPMIYRRFTEKSAEEWRQIYKSLQLLEFLVRNGSERVIDDARSHLSLLKMLRQFHYIDSNGKDQGINVRNRAKELGEMLSDVDRIRAERKKSRETKKKYTGVEGGAGFSGGSSGGRYGGFGNESGGDSYGGYSGRVYGDGGGFGGQEDDYSAAPSSSRRDRFEEYDEFDNDEAKASRPAHKVVYAPPKKAEPPKPKAPEVDLFSFDDPISAPAAAPPAPSAAAALAPADDDDEFDDFQSAPVATATSTAPLAAPKPVSAPQQANLSGMMSLSSLSPAGTGSPAATASPAVTSSIAPPPSGPNYSSFSMSAPAPPVAAAPAPATAPVQKPTFSQPVSSAPNYFSAVSTTPGTGLSSSNTPLATPPATSTKTMGMGSIKPVTSSNTSTPKPAGGDAFGALWSQASVSIKKPETSTPSQSMGQLAKEQSSAGLWGAPAGAPKPPQPSGSDFDLLG